MVGKSERDWGSPGTRENNNVSVIPPTFTKSTEKTSFGEVTEIVAGSLQISDQPARVTLVLRIYINFILRYI